jgi:hypothetical protein
MRDRTAFPWIAATSTRICGVNVARVLARSLLLPYLALLLGAGPFDSLELEHGGAPPLLIVLEYVFAAISR